MPTTGTLYGSWIPDTGTRQDFTLTYVTTVNFRAGGGASWVNNDTSFHIADFGGTVDNGEFRVYSDAARTTQINLDTRPITT